MPNGLYVCVPCYKHRNPLFKFGQLNWIWNNRKELPKDKREEVEKEGAPPLIHKVHQHPLIKAAYAMLKKNKKFSLPDLEGR